MAFLKVIQKVYHFLFMQNNLFILNQIYLFFITIQQSIIIICPFQKIMNFLRHLLQLNPCQHNDSDRQRQESGQFQVIQMEDPCNMEQNKQNIKQIDQCTVSYKGLSRKLSQNQITNQNKKQKKNPQNDTISEEQKIFNERLSKQYTIIQIDEDQLKSQLKQKSNGSASTIKIDDYYMIVNTQELTKKFQSPQQWNQFFKKINNFHQEINKCTVSSMNVSSIKPHTEKKKSKISLTIKELNSILQIKPQQLSLREQYWNSIAYSPITIRFKYNQLANKKDPQKLQKNVAKIMDTLAPSILFQIVERKYKVIQNVEDQLQKWKCYITKLLTLYGANDRQIGYSKGLQYLALGILVSKPFGVKAQASSQNIQHSCYFSDLSNQNSISKISNQLGAITKNHEEYSSLQCHFKYLLFTKQLRNMYFPGTPKLYQQIQLLTQLMRNQVTQLYQLLQKSKVDLIKLFINYYKTFLLYRIKNPQVIRKIMQLLIVYGIDIVRVLITRILNKNQKKILQINDQMELLKYLADQIVQDYFGMSDAQEVVIKFRDLFILDIDK